MVQPGIHFQWMFWFCFTSTRALAAHAEVLANKGKGADRAAVLLAGGGGGEDAVADLIEQGRWQVMYTTDSRFSLFV